MYDRFVGMYHESVQRKLQWVLFYFIHFINRSFNHLLHHGEHSTYKKKHGVNVRFVETIGEWWLLKLRCFLFSLLKKLPCSLSAIKGVL